MADSNSDGVPVEIEVVVVQRWLIGIDMPDQGLPHLRREVRCRQRVVQGTRLPVEDVGIGLIAIGGLEVS